jgi:hypothetical protein
MNYRNHADSALVLGSRQISSTIGPPRPPLHDDVASLQTPRNESDLFFSLER